jgi:hypothetical protein
MAKAAKKSTTPTAPRAPRITPTSYKNPDAAIFAMGRRHDELWAELGDLHEDDRRILRISTEAIELSHRVLLFGVVTKEGLAEKERIVDREDIMVQSDHALQTVKGGCAGDFIAFIYKLDEERIAAA